MREDGAGRPLTWMATGAAVLAAGALLGATAGRRREQEDDDFADRPVARAALADARGAGQRLDRLSETLSGLDARVQSIEDSPPGRAEIVWQRILRLEEKLEQLRTERAAPVSVETVAAQAEERLLPRLSALETRVAQNESAIQELRAHAAQTAANLQKMIGVVKKLANQVQGLAGSEPARRAEEGNRPARG